MRKLRLDTAPSNHSKWPRACRDRKNFTQFCLYRLPALLLFIVVAFSVQAQDPSLPPVNLGQANLMDGVAGPPGWVYVTYAQVYRTRDVLNGTGTPLPGDIKVNSLVSVHQLIYLSKIRLLSGNLAFTGIVPLAQITASGGVRAPTVNPGIIGDPVFGTALQWSDKKLFRHSFSHRVEADVSLPIGAYSNGYNINPSSHFFGFSGYHALTYYFNNTLSLSIRNQININTHLKGTPAHAGAFYNGNYSIEQSLSKKIRAEFAGYYLTQISEDSYRGDALYFPMQNGALTTKERVLGLGPGLGLLLSGGLLIEGKVFWETLGRNRSEGTRAVMRVSIPLSI